jgi:hypothetical protein
MTTSEKIKDAIKNIISTMMDRVMENVLVKDPFVPEKYYSENSLFATFLPNEIFRVQHFQRTFVEQFKDLWEKLAVVAGELAFEKSVQGYEIHGQIPEKRFNRIREVLAKLEHPEKGEKRIKPNWDEELKYILEAQGELLPATVVCDLYLEKGDKKYAFELKSPLPNSDITKVSKEKMFKLYSMVNQPITDAFYALPYNPYGKREDYAWSFPARWFDMKNDKSVMIGNEFWDFIGGAGTYQLFIDEINKLGLEYRERIYKEYLEIEPVQNKFQL